MNKYDQLRAEFIKKHATADEFVYEEATNNPVKAIYFAPDPDTDYEAIDELLKEINEPIKR